MNAGEYRGTIKAQAGQEKPGYMREQHNERSVRGEEKRPPERAAETLEWEQKGRYI